MIESYKLLQDILQDMGYIIFDEIDDDFDIRGYIGDSITFVEFIVNIEKKLDIELSDDFLLYELLESARGFAYKIDVFQFEMSKIGNI